MLYKENDIHNKFDKVSAFSGERLIIYPGCKYENLFIACNNFDEYFGAYLLKDIQEDYSRRKTVKDWAYKGNYDIDHLKQFNGYKNSLRNYFGKE